MIKSYPITGLISLKDNQPSISQVSLFCNHTGKSTGRTNTVTSRTERLKNYSLVNIKNKKALKTSLIVTTISLKAKEYLYTLERNKLKRECFSGYKNRFKITFTNGVGRLI